MPSALAANRAQNRINARDRRRRAARTCTIRWGCSANPRWGLSVRALTTSDKQRLFEGHALFGLLAPDV
jgi:hypothetical protein